MTLKTLLTGWDSPWTQTAPPQGEFLTRVRVEPTGRLNAVKLKSEESFPQVRWLTPDPLRRVCSWSSTRPMSKASARRQTPAVIIYHDELHASEKPAPCAMWPSARREPTRVVLCETRRAARGMLQHAGCCRVLQAGEHIHACEILMLEHKARGT